MSRGFGRFWEPRPFGDPFADPRRGGLLRRPPPATRPAPPPVADPGAPPQRGARTFPVVVPIHPPPTEPLRRPAPSEPIRRPADPPLEQARASEPPASGPQHVGPHHSEPQWPIADGASPQDELERAKARIERQASIETALHKRELIASFLEVLDDLDRALDAARAAGDAEALTRGVEMVRASFIAKLAQHGVVPADVLGEPFAPQRHEALASVPVRDPAERGHVVGVIRAGYTIDGDLLRPAGVAVGS